MGISFSPSVLGWLPVWESRVPVLPHIGHRPCWKRIQQPRSNMPITGWSVVLAWGEWELSRPGLSLAASHTVSFPHMGTHPLTGCINPQVKCKLQSHATMATLIQGGDTTQIHTSYTGQEGVSGRSAMVEQVSGHQKMSKRWNVSQMKFEVIA